MEITQEKWTKMNEALENVLGLLDNPIARQRHNNDSFYLEVLASVKQALNDSPEERIERITNEFSKLTEMHRNKNQNDTSMTETRMSNFDTMHSNERAHYIVEDIIDPFGNTRF